jgi:type IV pilus assembly protein PilB
MLEKRRNCASSYAKSMRQSGLTKLQEGVTSFEEVLRVTVADD